VINAIVKSIWIHYNVSSYFTANIIFLEEYRMIKKFLACNTVRERLDLLSNTVRDNWTDQDRGIILNVFNMNAEDYASKEDKITAIEKYGCL